MTQIETGAQYWLECLLLLFNFESEKKKKNAEKVDEGHARTFLLCHHSRMNSHGMFQIGDNGAGVGFYRLMKAV